MKNLKKTRQLFKLTLFVFSFIILMTSCGSEDMVATDNPMNSDGNPSTTITTLSDLEKKFIKQIKQASDEYDKNDIWNGYDFSKRPMYYISVDADNKPISGLLVNPKKEFSGAVKISANDNLGLNLYRFNKDMDKAMNVLKQGNGLFEFYYNIEGDDHYLQLYSEESTNDNLNPAIMLAVHEMFHIYQFSDWIRTTNVLQDEANYPITKNLLALQILNIYVSEKMPKETDKNKVKEYLKMYVAIRSKEIELDPSPEKFVRNMANEQEKGEGTARYIDNTLGKKIITGFTVEYGSPQVYSSFTTKKEVREEFAFGIWYNTGAAAVYMLKNQGIAIENDIKQGKTLFDIAEAALNLSELQKAAALQKAKDEFNFSSIEDLAKRLAEL